MRITQIKIKKFRILSDVTMDLDPVVTLIVGKNNSGKTSLTEIFNHFFSENEKYKFKFNDFSLNSHGLFQKSYDSYLDYEDKSMTSSDSEIKDMEERYKALFPKIEAKVFIEYDEADDDKLSALSNFLMDLDTERRDATILCQYSVFELKRCFQNYQKNKIKYKGFIDFLANNENLFEKKFFAVDKDNTEYQISIEKQKQIEDVFLPRFIRAKVNLDDNSDDKSRNLSKGFENYYKYNKENNKGAEELKKSLDTTSETLDRNYEDFFSTIFTDLQTFGIDTGIDNMRIKS